MLSLPKFSTQRSSNHQRTTVSSFHPNWSSSLLSTETMRGSVSPSGHEIHLRLSSVNAVNGSPFPKTFLTAALVELSIIVSGSCS